MRNNAPLGPHSRTMPMAPWWSQGRGLFLTSEVLLSGLRVGGTRPPRLQTPTPKYAPPPVRVGQGGVGEGGVGWGRVGWGEAPPHVLEQTPVPGHCESAVHALPPFDLQQDRGAGFMVQGAGLRVEG